MTAVKIEDIARPVGKKSRFQPVPFHKIRASEKAEYRIKGLIPKTGLVLVWGPPKCGKSFWVFDAAMHIALGVEYRGRRVKAGPVVYLAAEGAHGFRGRVDAYRQHRCGDVQAPFWLEPVRPDLVRDHAELIRVIGGLGEPPAVVVVDTLNRTMTGSESSDEDMTKYIQAADAIVAAFECAVIVVHHCGIEGTRPRGHTSLSGAVDAQIAIAKGASGHCTATLELVKDGPEGDALGFTLRTVEVGADEDGDPITSCVVEPDEVQAGAPAQRLTDKQRAALEILANLLTDEGRPAPASDPHFPESAIVASVDTWKEHLFRAEVLNRDASNPRTDFNRLRDQLKARGHIGIWDGKLWLVS